MKRLVLLSFVVLACSDSQAPQMIPQLSIRAGNNQITTVGKELPQAVEALLSDKTSGAPLPGRVVNWVVISGGGSVFAGVTETGVDGIAKQRWTLGGMVGEQRVVVRWVEPATGEPVTIDTAKAQAIAGVAAELHAQHSGPSSLAVGGEGLIEYWFEDDWGNETTVCKDGGSIHRIAWTSEDSNALEVTGTRILPNGRPAVVVTAKAARATGIAVTGIPDPACSSALSAGAVFTVP